MPYNGTAQSVAGIQNVVTGACTPSPSAGQPSGAATKAASSTLLSFKMTPVGQSGPYAPTRPASPPLPPTVNVSPAAASSQCCETELDPACTEIAFWPML